MTEEIRVIPRAVVPVTPTPRDLVAIFFRKQRLFCRSFLVAFIVLLTYGLLFPSYKAEMKILLQRGRIDPAISSAPNQISQLARDEVTEEELNSEAELLHDRGVLEAAALKSGWWRPSKFWSMLGRNHDSQLEHAIYRLNRNLKIEPVRKATVITVSFTGADPRLAAGVLQNLSSAYLELHGRVHRPTGQYEFFDRQFQTAKQDLEQKEDELLKFSHEQGVVSAVAERDNTLLKLSQADQDNQQIKVAIAEAAQRVRTLELKLPSLPEHVTTKTSNADNPQLLEKLKSRLLELRLKRTELLAKFGSSYRLVRETDEEIEQAKAAIDSEEKLPLREQTVEQEPNHEWTKSELLKSQVNLNSLLARSSATANELAGYKRTAQELGDRALRQQALLDNLKLAEQDYALYASKREEARIGDALDRSGIVNATIAEFPTPPVLPVHSAAVIGLVALALSACSSGGIVLVADRLDPTFRTPEEVWGQLGTRVLASLPSRQV